MTFCWSIAHNLVWSAMQVEVGNQCIPKTNKQAQHHHRPPGRVRRLSQVVKYKLNC